MRRKCVEKRQDDESLEPIRCERPSCIYSGQRLRILEKTTFDSLNAAGTWALSATVKARKCPKGTLRRDTGSEEPTVHVNSLRDNHSTCSALLTCTHHQVLRTILCVSVFVF